MVFCSLIVVALFGISEVKMKFKLTKSSNPFWSQVLELQTLDDLIHLIKMHDCSVIVSDGEIEIYDNYRE